MICKTCRKAGDKNKFALENEVLDTYYSNFLLSMHEHGCEGGCDCQHKVGKWVVPHAAEPAR